MKNISLVDNIHASNYAAQLISRFPKLFPPLHLAFYARHMHSERTKTTSIDTKPPWEIRKFRNNERLKPFPLSTHLFLVDFLQVFLTCGCFCRHNCGTPPARLTPPDDSWMPFVKSLFLGFSFCAFCKQIFRPSL